MDKPMNLDTEITEFESLAAPDWKDSPAALGVLFGPGALIALI